MSLHISWYAYLPHETEMNTHAYTHATLYRVSSPTLGDALDPEL